MKIKQLSVFLENRVGRLSEVCRILANGNINIIASSLADTSDFGIFRMIVDKPEEAKNLLTKNNFTILENEVLAIDVEDTPGGLAHILEIIEKEGTNVEYLYVLARREKGKITFIFRFENINRAIDILVKYDIKIHYRSDIISL